MNKQVNWQTNIHTVVFYLKRQRIISFSLFVYAFMTQALFAESRKLSIAISATDHRHQLSTLITANIQIGDIKRERGYGQRYWDLRQKLVKRIVPIWNRREEQNTNLISAISVSSKMAIKSFYYHRNHFVKSTKTLKNQRKKGIINISRALQNSTRIDRGTIVQNDCRLTRIPESRPPNVSQNFGLLKPYPIAP